MGGRGNVARAAPALSSAALFILTLPAIRLGRCLSQLPAPHVKDTRSPVQPRDGLMDTTQWYTHFAGAAVDIWTAETKNSTTVVELVADASVATSQKQKNTKPWWWCLKKKLRKKNRVTPVINENEVVELKGLTSKKARKLPGLDDMVLQTVPKTGEEEEEEEDEEDDLLNLLPSEAKIKGGKAVYSTTKTIRQQQIKCVGFPNPFHFCYINSCLQSLLTLTDFTASISRQELVWSSVPEAAPLFTSFMDIEGSHFSGDFQHKICLIRKFKDSILSAEFQDNEQKDAHEFLVCMLEQMRSSSSLLQSMAAHMGGSYSCPVQDHMGFKMRHTRTCKSCGKGYTRVEEFTNLSLDLIPGGGSVEQMLEDYQNEKELEYRCECGANRSSQRLSFLTMPKVLLLHLKRFRVTPSFRLGKVHDPVDLQRELVLTSNQAGSCYSLVSIINHFGFTEKIGHYICDGMDPDLGQEDPTDRWFTYNDAVVTETRGNRVCDQRKRISYILFYKRQEQHPVPQPSSSSQGLPPRP